MSAPAHPSSGADHGDRASLHRFVAALAAAGVWHQVRGDHVTFRCPRPSHEDRDASGSADWKPPSGDRPGRVGLVCHACGPAANDELISSLGLRWGDLFDDAPARPPRARSSGTARTAAQSRRRRSSTTTGAGEPARSAPATGAKATPPRARGRLVATYVYRDAAGELVGECRRYESREVDPAKGKPSKTFSWRRPGPAGGWIYKMPAECPLYRMPDLVAARAAADGPVTVWLVEGEKNADALAAAGVLAVSAPNGAHYGWRDSYTDALAGAHVIVVADRDEQGMARAEAVARELEPVAASLRVVRTPVDRKGADASDHLDAGLPPELDAFEVVERPAPAEEGRAAEGAALPAEHADDAAGTRTGEVVPFPGARPPDREGRRSGGDGGGAGRRRRLRVVREAFEVLEDEDAVVHVKRVRGENGEWEEIATELLNAQVRITRRIAVDPGDGSDTESELRTTHVDLRAEQRGEVIELRRVPWDEFKKGEYLLRLPWPLTWNDTPSGRSKLQNAIVATSGPVPVTPAYATLGWREIGGTWTYVHAGGGISAAGPVPGIEVEVAPRLRKFTLPDPPAGADELAAALRGVLGVLEALPARIAAPVMGAPLRAILGQTRASVFIVGHTGSRKSGVAALAQQVFMPTARHNRLPVGAGEAASTAAGMEELLWQAGEALLVADDLAPDRGAERSAMRANELLRAVGNGNPKLRGARAGGLREDRPPRALLMLTGEDGASKPSAESRTVYVPLAPGDVRLDVIRELSTREMIAGRNATGAALVQWVAGRMPIEDWVESARQSYAAALLAARGVDPGKDVDGLASRRADAVAELAVGWRALLDAALAGGALDEAAAGGVWSRAWAGLVECLAGQAEVAERRDLVERAADLLRSALRSGRAHLQAESGGAPEGARLWACGWRKDDSQFGDIRPGGEAVGWVTDDGSRVWLDPGAAFSAMERQARGESDPLGVTARALVKALMAARDRDGMPILSTERVAGRTTPAPQVRRRAAGVRQRVWELPWSWLWPDDVDDDGPAGEGGPAGGRPQGPDDRTPLAPPPAVPAPPRTDPLPAGSSTPTTPETGAESASEPLVDAGKAEHPPSDRASCTEPLSARPDVGAETRYAAPGVVVDVDGGRLIGGERVTVPTDLDSLPALVEWAEGLQLGIEHSRSRDDAGQVWVMPALARRLGLRKRPDAGSARATSSHPAVKALTAAGWSVGHRGIQPWTHVWRPGEAGMYVVVVPWLTESAICSPKDPPSVDTLADRLDLYSTAVLSPAGERQPWLFSAATTGTSLLKLCRATARSGDSLQVSKLPPPALVATNEPEFAWQRGPTPKERRRPWVVGWDVNAQYLAAAGSVLLGLGDPRHVTNVPPLSSGLGSPDRPARSTKLPPGYWRVPAEPAALELLPDLLDPASTGKQRDWVWITTPTLVVARQHGIDLQPVEAWLWDNATTWMQTWAHSLRDARYLLDGVLRHHPDDEETRVVYGAVKLTYAAGIGMLGSEKYRKDSDHYRPDARHQVIALAKANLFRKIARAAAAGCAPLGIHRDTVLFAADSNDPNQEPPEGFRVGTKLGEVKWVGAARMDDIADALAASPEPSPDTFGLLVP